MATGRVKGVNIKIICVVAFFATYLLVGLAVYDDFGVSWDEPRGRINGLVTLKYIGEKTAPAPMERFLNEPSDIPPLETYFDRDYGIAFELPLVFGEKLLNLQDSRDVYRFRHLMNFLVCFVGSWFFFLLVQERFNSWGMGLLGTSLLILSPRFFAESFYNSKDLIFMSLMTISLYLTVKFLKDVRVRSSLFYGLSTAALLNVRLMGVLIPAVGIFFLALFTCQKRISAHTAIKNGVLYLLVTGIALVAMWPYLWSAPWDNFAQAFTNMANFRWGVGVLYFGERIIADQLPWHYILAWIGITTPPVYLILALIGVFAVVLNRIKQRIFHWQSDADWQDAIFLGLFLAPLASVIVLGSTLYDGWRQMYFIYPALLMIALRGLVSVWGWVRSLQRPWLTYVISLVGVSSLLLNLTWMIKNHPNQYAYFNVFAGDDVKSNFEVDYWGLTSRQGVEYIASQDTSTDIKIWPGSLFPLIHAKYMMLPGDRERFTVVGREQKADYVLTQYRNNLKDFGSGEDGYELFYQLLVDGEPIMSVYKR